MPGASRPKPLLYSVHMNHGAPGAEGHLEPRSRTGTYVAVILAEVLVVGALYLFGRYFSA